MKKANEPEKILKESKLKITQNRIIVLKFLKGSNRPITVDEISKKLKINIVTIYRILESFVSKNLVYKTDFRQGKSFFEYQDHEHHHHHITCSKCGFRDHVDFCIDETTFIKLQNSKSFKKIDGHILEFFGICKKCN